MKDQDKYDDDPILLEKVSFTECRSILAGQLKELSKGGSEKIKMILMARLAMAEMGLGNMTEAEKLIDKCRNHILEYGPQKERGYVTFLIAVLLSAQADYEKGMPMALKALHIFTTLDIPVFEMRALIMCGRYCMRLHMTDEAIEYMNRAIEISRSLEDSAQTILCMFNLNDIKSEVLPQSETIRNAEQLVKHMTDTIGDAPSYMKANVYENAARVNIRGGQVKRAKVYAKVADDIRAMLKEDNATLMPDYYIMHAMISAVDDDERGMLAYTDTCISLCRKQKIILAALQAYEIRFKYYLRHGQPDLAKKYLDKAAAMAPGEENHLFASILSQCYSDYYKATGDANNELKYTKKSYEYKMHAQQLVLTHRIKHLNAIHELEIKEKENEIMKKELNIKSQELNLSNHYLQQRNDLLGDLKESINSLKKENSQREVIFQTLFRKIDMAFNKEENEKNLFKEKFDKAHTDFIRNLSNEYPKLSVTECRVCALLHSGFNTKEIATLLSTTERNIETHRLHVRKKMNLKRNDNLNLVLASIKF
ncbi:MAG: hypothetical protein JWO03_2799 [Bacteroidetes bacterium]|nr:hypothetical protein [Bacteroidota bacterium]